VAVPNQPCGLTTFDKRLPTCPPNPNSIRSIIFQKNNLSVVSGATTEIDISLLSLFIPVNSAARTTFNILGKIPQQPLNIYKLDLAGQDLNEEIKFLCLLPDYGNGSTPSLSVACGGSTVTQVSASEKEYIEWAFIDDIEAGQLYDAPNIGASATTSFDVAKINKMEFSWGGYVSATGSNGKMWVGTDGGLIKYDGTNSYLWNTLNSNSSSDFIYALDVDPNNFVWTGSNFGLSKFSEDTGFMTNWNTSNSSILSNNVNYVKLFGVNKIAIATDSGLSIFDKDRAWTNFTIYNTPELKQNNISVLSTDSDYLFLGTTGGVYVYNFTTNDWNSSPFGTGTTGWTAPLSVTALASSDNMLYVGTTAGLVIINYVGGTATSIYSGLSGPASDYYKSLRVVNNLLYAGHDDGLSIYDTATDTWTLAIDSSDYSYLASGIADVLPDTISGSGVIFMGGETGDAGLARFSTGPTAFSLVPEADKVTNLLMSFPLNPTSTPNELPPGVFGGNWQTVLNNVTNIEGSQLYPANQEMYFIFSKDMTGTGGTSSFQNFVNVSLGLTGSTATVTGSWSWDSTGRLGTFVPGTALEKAQGYNLTVSNGATASDNSYVKESLNVGFYTENIVPILGWNSLGKMLIHTGTENYLTQGLYLRNPQSTGVNVTTLIGR
jgi:hypothetical protein